MRHSQNEIVKNVSGGSVYNGFDYNLQVWVKEGVVLECGHPISMHPHCCNAQKLKGQRVADIQGHQQY